MHGYLQLLTAGMLEAGMLPFPWFLILGIENSCFSLAKVCKVFNTTTAKNKHQHVNVNKQKDSNDKEVLLLFYFYHKGKKDLYRAVPLYLLPDAESLAQMPRICQ
jgi:hypothetical protein